MLVQQIILTPHACRLLCREAIRGVTRHNGFDVLMEHQRCCSKRKSFPYSSTPPFAPAQLHPSELSYPRFYASLPHLISSPLLSSRADKLSRPILSSHPTPPPSSPHLHSSSLPRIAPRLIDQRNQCTWSPYGRHCVSHRSRHVLRGHTYHSEEQSPRSTRQYEDSATIEVAPDSNYLAHFISLSLRSEHHFSVYHPRVLLSATRALGIRSTAEPLYGKGWHGVFPIYTARRLRPQVITPDIILSASSFLTYSVHLIILTCVIQDICHGPFWRPRSAGVLRLRLPQLRPPRESICTSTSPNVHAFLAHLSVYLRMCIFMSVVASVSRSVCSWSRCQGPPSPYLTSDQVSTTHHLL